MNAWLNWRTGISSITLALLMTLSLIQLTDKEFSLSGLDLFFATTTVISLGVNLWQLFRDRYKYTPLKNSLIGLFNDLKSRQLRAYRRQQLITSSSGAALSLEAIRLEFSDFGYETTQSLDQLREHVVAAIHTLDPDASTQQIFRASEFGLTDKERQFREEGMERFIENARGSAQVAPQAHPLIPALTGEAPPVATPRANGR